MQETAISEERSCPATVASITPSGRVKPCGIELIKLSLKTLLRKVEYRTSRISGVIIEEKTMPLSEKNIFIFLIISAFDFIIKPSFQVFIVEPCDRSRLRKHHPSCL